MTEANNKLAVQGLHLSYGDNAILKGVSMWLKQGEVVSLLGPSGSGKTTLLRAVAGLEAPRQGTIRIEDKPVYDGSQKLEVPAERRNLGLVFQSYALWPHRTVFDNVAYGLKLRKVPTGEIKSRVDSALQNLGLGHLGARFPRQLSGGQQQRVAIARSGPHSEKPSPAMRALSPRTSPILPSMRMLLPMNSAANSVCGLPYMDSGVPSCSITPLFRSRMRSDIAIASLWSCATTSAERCILRISSRSQARASSRSFASRFDSGSSIRMTGGL